MGVGKVTGICLRSAENAAHEPSERAVGISHANSGFSSETGVDDLVVSLAAVELGEDDRWDDDITLQPLGGLHGRSYLSLPS